MTTSWTTWFLVFASLVLLSMFGRLDLLALVVPVSAVVAFGLWAAKRHASRRALR